MTASITHPSLYAEDYALWLSETIALLRTGQLGSVDFEHLIEELEDMGISQKQALESNLIVLLMHLLKWKYQPSKRSGSWRSTIREHRRRILRSFADSPSLKRYFGDIFEGCYQEARQQAADETELDLAVFGVNCSFSVDDILNPDYLPNQEVR
jgi:hypothetical protein